MLDMVHQIAQENLPLAGQADVGTLIATKKNHLQSLRNTNFGAVVSKARPMRSRGA
jgi:hypothetical protein